MIDVTTRQPLRIAADGADAAYLMIADDQLPAVCALLDRHRIGYSVDEESISIDDEPFVTFIEFDPGTDPEQVQQVLDSVP